MSARKLGVASLGLLACSALTVPAFAGSFTLADSYSGATVCCGITLFGGGDTVENAGTNNFQIDSLTASRSSANGPLTVTITTWYAGQTGLDSTQYGSLFFGSATAWNQAVLSNNQSNNNFAGTANDSFHAGLWTSAFVVPGSQPGGNLSNVSGGLYSIGTTQTPNGSSPYVSYTTTNASTNMGNITMSNYLGNPLSPSGGGIFREGQAVQFSPDGSNGSSATGTMSVVASTATEGTITYTINDNGALGNDFAISWAMTCANDIIQGVVDLGTTTGGGGSTVPLPAGLPLFAGGLGLLGFFGRRRKKLLSEGV